MLHELDQLKRRLTYFPLTWTTLLEVGSEKCIASKCTTITADHGRGGKDERLSPLLLCLVPEHSSKRRLSLALLVGENFP